MNPQHHLATPTCFGTRSFFCALLPSDLFAPIGGNRKHLPNLRTSPDPTSDNLTLYCFPDTALALPSHRPPIQTP